MRKNSVFRIQYASEQKVVVGMSGGVDSTISLILLKKAGWQPLGVTLKLPIWEDRCNLLRENVCCTAESIKTAQEFCKKVNVPYHIIDAREVFKKEVVGYFTSELKKGRTPNPCIVCNRYLKYKLLFDFGKKVGARYVATGHYVRKRFNKKTGNYELLVAKDKKKDQTYSLCFLPQKWLKYIIFPLGDYTKEEVYKIAQEIGLDFYLKTKQSQDFCFVSGRSIKSFIKKEIKPKPGKIFDKNGKFLGRHTGLSCYTVGQRKGIRLPGGPWYVIGFDRAQNILYVSRDKNDLLKNRLIIEPYSLISEEKIEKPIEVYLRARYHQRTVPAILKPSKKADQIIAVLKKPLSSPTPGQFAVFYKGQVCLGGGRIVEANSE
ncbi:MAG: tRNA 2-thiouridine(34) synthase MnmA [Nitrososphaeria archaeon]